MDFGARMKEIRKLKGLKQADVAKDMLTSQSYISAVETGQEAATPRFQKMFWLLYADGADPSETEGTMKKMVYICDRCRQPIADAGASIVPVFFDPDSGRQMEGKTRLEMEDLHFCVECVCRIMENVISLCAGEPQDALEAEAGHRGKETLDTGKVMALHNAGWDNKKIAEEMRVDEKKIYQCIYYQQSKNRRAESAGKTEDKDEE